MQNDFKPQNPEVTPAEPSMPASATPVSNTQPQVATVKPRKSRLGMFLIAIVLLIAVLVGAGYMIASIKKS